MRVYEVAEVPLASLPVEEMTAHLRLGRGFSDDTVQDELVAGYLRAALAAIEGRIGKALIERAFVLELSCWRDPAEQPLPLAPVSEVTQVSVAGASGPEVEIAAHRWRLVRDLQRPKVVGQRISLPAVPEGGRARIAFKAGFGTWLAVPPELRQAVLLLAAQFYEWRHEGGMKSGALPFGVAALIERWRTVRVLAGGR